MAAREAGRLRGNLTSPDVIRNEPLREPWAAHVARRARGIIVHSAFCKAYLEEAGCRTPVFVVPHPVVESPQAFERAAVRARTLRAPLETRGVRHLIVAPGDLNEAKRLDALAAAATQLPDDAHVAIVGRRIEGYDVQPAVDAARAGDRVSVFADVDDADFLGWLAAADVVVDLRFPHRGEVSGSLARAMQAGKPDGGERHRHLPGHPRRLRAACRRRPGRSVGARPAAPHAAGGRRAPRSAWGRPRPRTCVSSATVRPPPTATSTRSSGRSSSSETPGRKAMAIWGKSLVDVGISEAMVDEGYGMEYARALESFKTSP